MSETEPAAVPHGVVTVVLSPVEADALEWFLIEDLPYTKETQRLLSPLAWMVRRDARMKAWETGQGTLPLYLTSTEWATLCRVCRLAWENPYRSIPVGRKNALQSLYGKLRELEFAVLVLESEAS